MLPLQSHSFKFRSTTLCVLIIFISLSACSSIARFEKNSPIILHPTKNEPFELKVSNWSNENSLTLMNGGPYNSNGIYFPIGVKFIQRRGSTVVGVDDNNDLHVVDFSVNPAKETLQTPLRENVTALAVLDNDVFVGLENTGVVRININELKGSITKTKFSDENNVTRIRIFDGDVYLLSNNNKITQYNVNLKDNGSPTIVASWALPGNCNDFSSINDALVLLGPNYGLGIIKKSAPSGFVSTLPLQGSKQQLTVSGNTALVADGLAGMVVVGLQDLQNPRWIGSHNKLGSIEKIIIHDKNAYVVDRDTRISSINLSNHELPITGSFFKPENKVRDVIIADTTEDKNVSVFVATSAGIEQVVFPANSHGQISNEGINQGGTRRAFITNKLAYVADWFSGLHIYDISDPSKPRHIGNMHTPGSSKGVIVENGYAYVGDDDYGLQIVDVRDPEKPVIVGNVRTTGLAYTLKKRGDLVFLADHRGGFHIIDVKDVSKPFIVASHNTNGKSWAIDIRDNIAFVADDNSGLLVFDISTIDKPVQIGQFSPDGYAEDVIIRNNIAYVTFFDKGLYLLDVKNPSKPELISHLDIPGNARSVVLKDQFAYIAGWESGVHVVDIANSNEPQIVGSFDTSGSAWGADINGNHLYVWDWWGGVKVIDITNPRKPVLKSQYHAASKINKLRQKNNFIYTANHTAGIQVFDANNVLNPIWSTGIDIEGKVLDVWPSRKLPYLFAISDQQGLLLLDIADPFYISLLDQHSISGTPEIVREFNGNIFVTTTSGELHIFNIENAKLNKRQSLKLDVNDLWVNQQTLFVASANEGLLALTIDESGSINPKKQLINEKVFKVGASEKFVVAATENYGLDLWQRTTSGLKPVADISIDDRILGIALQDYDLFVLTQNDGLIHFQLSGEDIPRVIARYPATDNYSDILLHNNAVFFAGQSTIASVQLLPKLEWQPLDKDSVQVKAVGKFPVGNYHLAISDLKGNEILWPNAIRVMLKKSGKPKISIEQFQKLLEQHRKNQ